MALITGLPNFFTTTKPASADFNNAAKAILSQVGGAYYDEAQSAYVSAPGGLDTTNIANPASFTNSQKAEPWSPMLCAMSPTFINSPPISYCGPFAFDYLVSSVTVAVRTQTSFANSMGSFDNYVTGGTVAAYIINPYYGSYLVNTLAVVNPGKNNGDSSSLVGELNLRAGDFLFLGYSGLTLATADAQANVYATLYGKAMHVR